MTVRATRNESKGETAARTHGKRDKGRYTSAAAWHYCCRHVASSPYDGEKERRPRQIKGEGAAHS